MMIGDHTFKYANKFPGHGQYDSSMHSASHHPCILQNHVYFKKVTQPSAEDESDHESDHTLPGNNTLQ